MPDNTIKKHKEEIKRKNNAFYHSHKYRNAMYYRNKVSGQAQYVKKSGTNVFE